MSKAEIIKLVIECMFYTSIIIGVLVVPILFNEDNKYPYDGWLGLILGYGSMLFLGAIAASLVWLVFNV